MATYYTLYDKASGSYLSVTKTPIPANRLVGHNWAVAITEGNEGVWNTTTHVYDPYPDPIKQVSYEDYLRTIISETEWIAIYARAKTDGRAEYNLERLKSKAYTSGFIKLGTGTKAALDYFESLGDLDPGRADEIINFSDPAIVRLVRVIK